MQQNMPYGIGYYAPPPPSFDQAPPVAPDYGPAAYGPPPSSSSPASPYSSAPSYDAIYPAAAPNPADPSYYAANHPYAPQVPAIPLADPSFNSPNSSYMPSNSLYGPPQGPSSYEATYDRSFDYGSAPLPHSISTPSIPSQPYGSSPSLYRSGSFHKGFPQPVTVKASQGSGGYADHGGSGAYISSKPLGYDQSNSGYLQGRGYEQLGQASYDIGPPDSYKYSDVYAYDGGQVEPYGSRGTRSTETSSIFNPLGTSGNSAKVARASPKSDADTGGNGVQKYRVKLLSESSSSDPTTDVLCQIGLDGVRMVVPATNKLLRIYPLETITKWEVSDSSTFTFWAKTIVDVEQRRIRLQSSSYTTSAILDTLTAACVQLCEMVDKDMPSEASNGSTSTSGSAETGSQKKSSFADWVTLKSKSAGQEEKQHWVPDEAVTKCTACGADFGAFIRRHHCRNCGDIFCDKCTRGRTPLTSDQDAQPVRVCDQCLAEVTQRLTNVESTNKPAVQRRHEDLAKKLQEELEKNAARKPSGGSSDNSGSFSSRSVRSGSSDAAVHHGSPHLRSNQSAPEGSGPRMREVACPTCTVHLQVQVPSFGTETVECGVCQHPFLVSAH
ncbi:hypothetical protein O6H91_08G088700 [Diphasiastrum complanatum]|uniref:Uncharacterized protein n=1 Tax=Diphasiastrum complanatum TaxID=34168 RepID=A0ACC2CZT4_DIPCM|nr:hypothetical protein O6H91_08G088700 [Diphasiastrum complanatum]